MTMVQGSRNHGYENRMNIVQAIVTTVTMIREVLKRRYWWRSYRISSLRKCIPVRMISSVVLEECMAVEVISQRTSTELEEGERRSSLATLFRSTVVNVESQKYWRREPCVTFSGENLGDNPQELCWNRDTGLFASSFAVGFFLSS